MKNAIFALSVIGLLAVSGCDTFNGIKRSNDEKLSPKEIAAANARKMYGDKKPYTYYWTDEKDGYIIQGQALVVPGEPYRGVKK